MMGVEQQGLRQSRHRYQVVPRTLVFITNTDNDKEVLLLKGASDKKIWPNLYNGIGGHIENGELVRQSALREVEEEAGLTVLQDFTLRGIINIETEDPLTGIMLFVFTGVSPTRAVNGSGEGRTEWVRWQDLPPESMVPDLPVLLPRVLSMPPQASPFFARYWYEGDKLRISFDESS